MPDTIKIKLTDEKETYLECTFKLICDDKIVVCSEEVSTCPHQYYYGNRIFCSHPDSLDLLQNSKSDNFDY